MRIGADARPVGTNLLPAGSICIRRRAFRMDALLIPVPTPFAPLPTVTGPGSAAITPKTSAEVRP